MKRAASALAALGLAALAVAPAAAATTAGAVKMTWNVSVAATLNLTTNYAVTTGAQSLGANVLQGAPAATCASGTSETAFNLTYGALTPSVTVATACNYQKAIAAQVTTNSTNWNVTQFLSAAAPTGIGFCAFSNGAPSASAPASSQATAPAAGTYTSGSLTGCATGGVAIPAGTAGSGTAPGNPGTTGLVTATAPGSPAAFCSNTSAGTFWCGEDMQINLAANQPVATAQSSYLIVQLIAN